MTTEALRTIQQRGRSSRLSYWYDWAIRHGATEAQAERVAMECDYAMKVGRAPTIEDQYRTLRGVQEAA
jgi:hypothetical protein